MNKTNRFNEYVALNSRFIWWCVNKNKPHDVMFEDAYQEALVVLFGALDSYDSSKGKMTFESYLRTLIKYRMLELYTKESRMPEFLEFKPELVADVGTETNEDRVIRLETVAALKSSVTPRQWGIMQQRWIADMGLQEIAQFENVTPQRVDEILKIIKRNIIKSGTLNL